MLFLTKKKKKSRPLPIDEVAKLSKSGMNDKDIIKHLKSEGYTYDEIEKAMLMAMKSSVKSKNENNVGQAKQTENTFGDSQFQNTQMPSIPQGESFEHLGAEHNAQMNAPTDYTQSMVDNTIDINNIVEDIIQTMVNEKWEKIDARIKEVEREMEEAKKIISSLNMEKKEEINKDEIYGKFEEIETKLEDLEVRTGALEKSLKQLLPSLVDNIQNLSNVVETLKKRHEDLEKKAMRHIYGDDVPWNDSIKRASDERQQSS